MNSNRDDHNYLIKTKRATLKQMRQKQVNKFDKPTKIQGINHQPKYFY